MILFRFFDVELLGVPVSCIIVLSFDNGIACIKPFVAGASVEATSVVAGASVEGTSVEATSVVAGASVAGTSVAGASVVLGASVASGAGDADSAGIFQSSP